MEHDNKEFLTNAQEVALEAIQKTPPHMVPPPDTMSLVDRVFASDGGVVALPATLGLGVGLAGGKLGIPELACTALGILLFSAGAAYLDCRREYRAREPLSSIPRETYLQTS